MPLPVVHASEHQLEVARAALAQFPLDIHRMEFISDTDNEVFLVTEEGSADLCKYALRLQWREDNDSQGVESELRWLEALGDETPLVVPRPVHAHNGKLVVEVFDSVWNERRPCVLLEWVDGKFCDDALTSRHLYRVGETMAQLHEHAFRRARELSLDTRRVAFAADLSALLDESHPLRKGFDRDELDLIDEAIAQVSHVIENLGKDSSQYGYIHSDLHQWNYLFHEGEVRPIDFCDSGWGHYIYDIAITLGSLRYPLPGVRAYVDEYEALRAAFLEGYSKRRTLPLGWQQNIDFYVAGRLLLLSEVIVKHWSNPENLRPYVEQLPVRLRSLLAD